MFGQSNIKYLLSKKVFGLIKGSDIALLVLYIILFYVIKVLIMVFQVEYTASLLNSVFPTNELKVIYVTFQGLYFTVLYRQSVYVLQNLPQAHQLMRFMYDILEKSDHYQLKKLLSYLYTANLFVCAQLLPEVKKDYEVNKPSFLEVLSSEEIQKIEILKNENENFVCALDIVKDTLKESNDKVNSNTIEILKEVYSFESKCKILIDNSWLNMFSSLKKLATCVAYVYFASSLVCSQYSALTKNFNWFPLEFFYLFAYLSCFRLMNSIEKCENLDIKCLVEKARIECCKICSTIPNQSEIDLSAFKNERTFSPDVQLKKLDDF